MRPTAAARASRRRSSRSRVPATRASRISPPPSRARPTRPRGIRPAPRTVLVDNTAPTGALTAPADGAPVRATVTLESNASDAGSGVASVQFEVKGPGDSSFADLGAALTSAPFAYDWSTGPLEDGSYE